MCVDFTDQIVSCPKECFPLPRIDQMVDTVVEHELLSFLDAFPIYNQIMMVLEDRVYTSFITEYRTYYYIVMSFGLKNVGTTYQRMVTNVFKAILGNIKKSKIM